MKYFLSVYFGFHDSCITISSEKEVLLHLEAERVFRKKHIRIGRDKMVNLIKIGLDYLDLDIEEIEKLYLSKWNNQFDENNVLLFGKKFNPIMTNHHENHIGCALPYRFNDAIIVCADGGSEEGTTKIYLKKGKSFELLEDLGDTILTGKFYGTITQMIISPSFGRAHDTYPGKTMGLAAYGGYNEEIHNLIKENEKEINKLHFNGCEHLLDIFNISKDYSKPWEDKRRKDLAYTAQKYWIDSFYEKIKEYKEYSKNLLLVGGCTYNVSLNSRLADSGLFENVYVSPLSGDCGQSLGSIIFNNPEVKCNYPFLGRSFGKISENKREDVIELLVRDLLDNKMVAWYQEEGEVGPRALGHRSFIGLPNSIENKKRLSVEIKKREPYRPVAPIITKEALSDFFKTTTPSPFMTFSPDSKEITKKLAPAIIHEDGTSRLQTISKEDNYVLYNAIKKISKKTKSPIIMNTSFNLDGEPIVETPENALKTFKKSNADILYINGKRYEKNEI